MEVSPPCCDTKRLPAWLTAKRPFSARDAQTEERPAWLVERPNRKKSLNRSIPFLRLLPSPPLESFPRLLLGDHLLPITLFVQLRVTADSKILRSSGIAQPRSRTHACAPACSDDGGGADDGERVQLIATIRHPAASSRGCRFSRILRLEETALLGSKVWSID